jgi:hypothetical protein
VPQAAQIPNPTASDSTGLPESTWIAKVRDSLQDYPRWLLEGFTGDGVNGVNTASGAPFGVQFPKINGSSAASDNTPLVLDTTAAQSYAVVDFPTVPTGFQVQVNYDTGEFVFPTPPVNGHTFQISYQTCKWRDQSILDALTEGLHTLFPTVGKTYVDTSIQIKVNQWDYQLPAWFNDPRSLIIQIEVNDLNIPTEPFKIAPPGEERIGLGMLHMPWAQRFGPTAILRITAWGPYLRLGDLEPQLFHLPTWAALGSLLPKMEAKRIREDTLVPAAQIGAAQPTLHLQTGDYWERRFQAALAQLARLPGPTSRRPWASMRQRNRY